MRSYFKNSSLRLYAVKNPKSLPLIFLTSGLLIVLILTSYYVKNNKVAQESQAATSVLIDWNPAWDSTFGAAAASPLPPIKSWLTVQNGVLMRDGKEFIIFGAHLNRASTAIGANSYMTDEDNLKTIKRIAATGFNTIRLQGYDTSDMSGNSNSYGCWADSTGPDFSEKCMVQLDKTIARANQLGLQIWMGNFNYGSYASRMGFPSGGAAWSPKYRNEVMKPYILRYANRVNTQTGVKYKDNPGIMWQGFNEDGFSYNLFSEGQDFTNNSWTPELNSKILSYYQSKSWVLPGGKFPTRSTFSGWPTADKSHFLKFMSDTEIEYTKDLYSWYKTLNPNILVIMHTNLYMDAHVLGNTDISSVHIYARVPSGDPITVPPDYITRSSVLQDITGFYWSMKMDGNRFESTPFTVPEMGDYGLSRWDYEHPILEAIMADLQKTSGYVAFNESQSLTQAKASGVTYIHHHVGAPVRRLSDLLAAPIVKYRLIDPLPEKYVSVISDADYLAKQVERQRLHVSPFNFQSNGDGSERAYWLKRLYMKFGEPTNISNFPKVTDAQFAAGIQVPGGQVTAKATGVTVNAPAVVGLVNDLKNTTIGSMTLSGVTSVPNAIVMIRSDANYPLFSGPAKLFVHMNETVTDAAGWTGTIDGEHVTSWGTPANTRLVMPLPFSISFNTHGIALNISGVNDDGTTVPISTSFDGTNVKFMTDTRFPLYIVTPKGIVTTTPSIKPSSAVTPTIYQKPGDINSDGIVDIQDFQLLSNSFGKTQGQSGFNSNADINRDSVVDITDFQILSNNFCR